MKKTAKITLNSIKDSDAWMGLAYELKYEQFEKEHPEILNWADTTKISLAGKYLSIMKDFKYLKGSKVKILNKPQIPIETILYLIFYLKN